MAKLKGSLTGAAQVSPVDPGTIDRMRRQVEEHAQGEGVRRLNADIPVGLHTAFKAEATKHGLSMTDLLVLVLRAYLDHK
jgi:hypothetical protein